MNNWRLLLFGLFVILQASESFAERIVDGQQECCDRQSTSRHISTYGERTFKSEADIRQTVDNQRQTRESGSYSRVVQYDRNHNLKETRPLVEHRTKAQIRAITERRANSQIRVASERVANSQIRAATEREAYSQIRAATERGANSQIRAASERVDNSQIRAATGRGANSQIRAATERAANSQIRATTERVPLSQIRAATERVANSQIRAATERVANSQIRAATERAPNSQIRAATVRGANSQIRTATEQVANSQIRAATERVANSQIRAATERAANSQIRAPTERVIHSQIRGARERVANSQIRAARERVANSQIRAATERAANSQIRATTERVIHSQIRGARERVANSQIRAATERVADSQIRAANSQIRAATVRGANSQIHATTARVVNSLNQRAVEVRAALEQSEADRKTHNEKVVLTSRFRSQNKQESNRIFREDARYVSASIRFDSERDIQKTLESSQQRSSSRHQKDSQSRQSLYRSSVRDGDAARKLNLEIRAVARREIERARISGSADSSPRATSQRFRDSRIADYLIRDQNLLQRQHSSSRRTEVTRRSSEDRRSERFDSESRYIDNRITAARHVIERDSENDRRISRIRDDSARNVLRTREINSNFDRVSNEERVREPRNLDQNRERMVTRPLSQRKSNERSARQVRSSRIDVRGSRLTRSVDDRRILEARRTSGVDERRESSRNNENREVRFNTRARASNNRQNEMSRERYLAESVMKERLSDHVRAREERNIIPLTIHKSEIEGINPYVNWHTYVFYVVQALYLVNIFSRTLGNNKGKYGKSHWSTTMARSLIKVD